MADLFANRLSVPFTDGTKPGKSLADRISKGPNLLHGRLSSAHPESLINTQETSDHGIDIRGASGQQDQGLSIRGGAAAGTITRLFPGKQLRNAGKELFAEKLDRRGGRRNKAEDLFY